MQSLLKKQAILDIIVTPEQESWRRLVSYYYDEAKQCDIFKINNGSGDHLYIIFAKNGVILKGFDHESCFSPYQNGNTQLSHKIYAQAPASLVALLDDDMEKSDVTFCQWQLSGESTWHKAALPMQEACLQEDAQDDDGGEAYLLGYIFPDAEEWYNWASIYYELQEEAWDAAARLYESNEITRPMVMDLNPERDYDTIIDECEVTGLL